MSQQPITVVQGHGNIVGNYLNNVGNIVTNNFTNGPQLEREKFEPGSLESKVAFDALLKSDARYPAPRCHPHTRAAVQMVAKNWIRRRGDWADKVIMWISGAPGVGKSAVVQTVCEGTTVQGNGSRCSDLVIVTQLCSLNGACIDGPRDIHASYFFGRGLGDREKAFFFPPTVAYQLSRSKISCGKTINRTLKKQPEVLSEDFCSQFRQLLLQTAKSQWLLQSPITIVIDALDECDSTDDQVKLLDLIFETATSTNTRFLIASRPEQHIHAFFHKKEVSQHMYHIQLDDESFNTSRDIEVFLRSEFERIRLTKPELCLPLPNGDDWPGDLVIFRIRDDSDCQFIFLTLIIGHIDTPFYPPDEQLQAFLSAPPSRAFSKLDALYEHILSRCPPDLCEGSDELLAYQKLVLDILGVVVAWSEPVPATTIAGVLNRKVTVVQNIALGPMRSLFKFDASKPNSPILLCHKSLRDYLLDIERSHKFFVPSAEADTLFISILSRQPSADHWYTDDELWSVLTVTMYFPGKLSLSAIAEGLDVDPLLVERVLLGPANALFDVGSDHTIHFSSSSLNAFLCDFHRSGEFCVRPEDLDPILIRMLSRPAPSSLPMHYYSRDDLLDVLTALVVQPKGMTKQGMQDSLLHIDSHVVDRILAGPVKPLFDLDFTGEIKFSIPSLPSFFQNAGRSGESFIPGAGDPDAFLLRILSRRPPADPSRRYSHEVLIGVLEVLSVGDSRFNVPQIACALAVPHSLIRAVIFGPTKTIFEADDAEQHFLSTEVKDFLLDFDRSGRYFVQTSQPDTLFLRVLSRQSPPAPSGFCSSGLLQMILMMLVIADRYISVSQIAAALDVHSDDVMDVVFGWAGFLFGSRCVRKEMKFVGLAAGLKAFLQDENRAGEFYIPPHHLNPSFKSMYAKILKLPKDSYASNA